jgi:hypothetical protein
VSLSTDPAFPLLQKSCVCGWRDISNESYCGRSGRYDESEGAAYTTNGAGPHNIQMFLLSADGTVLHCLPGFWEADDFALEVKFAQKLDAVWRDGSKSRAQKEAKFREMHLAHLKDHPQEMVDRSTLQGFDKKFEEKRRATSDCFLTGKSLQPAHRPSRGGGDYKTTDQIMHERMAAQPFVSYEKFDVVRFTDYGRPRYDKKKVHEEGGTPTK